MKRIFLFLATNLAIVLVLGTVTSLLGVNQYFTRNGIDYASLLVFAGVMGFGGAFISLLMSKTVAKWSMRARVIGAPKTQDEQWLLETVGRLARKAGLPMPEVAVYDGDPNAFATGPSRSNSLVAVSTGLLRSMKKEEVEAVLAHEVAHIANGDMVTLTLIQGVVNTFVFFVARVVGYAVDQATRKHGGDGETHGAGGLGYMATVFICEMVFGILASAIVMSFSRQREFRADRGASSLMGSPTPMIAALRRLGGARSGELPQSMAASGIVGGGKLLALFTSHPPLEERIRRLKAQLP